MKKQNCLLLHKPTPDTGNIPSTLPQHSIAQLSIMIQLLHRHPSDPQHASQPACNMPCWLTAACNQVISCCLQPRQLVFNKVTAAPRVQHLHEHADIRLVPKNANMTASLRMQKSCGHMSLRDATSATSPSMNIAGCGRTQYNWELTICAAAVYIGPIQSAGLSHCVTLVCSNKTRQV